MPTFLRYLSVSLASALVAAYAALWVADGQVVHPPLVIEQQGDNLKLWGAWDTVAGYESPGANAVEIRCNRSTGTCQEAYASILHHVEGEDLDAAVYHYSVVEWTAQTLRATALTPDAECLTRNLVVALPAGTASLKLVPQGDDCAFDATTATLVGDPL